MLLESESHDRQQDSQRFGGPRVPGAGPSSRAQAKNEQTDAVPAVPSLGTLGRAPVDDSGGVRIGAEESLTGMRSKDARKPDPGAVGGPERVRWRRRRLLDAGFAPELAGEAAAQGAIDLHALIELVERDCPPHLAMRILAPLEGEERPC